MLMLNAYMHGIVSPLNVNVDNIAHSILIIVVDMYIDGCYHD